MRFPEADVAGDALETPLGAPRRDRSESAVTAEYTPMSRICCPDGRKGAVGALPRFLILTAAARGSGGLVVLPHHQLVADAFDRVCDQRGRWFGALGITAAGHSAGRRRVCGSCGAPGPTGPQAWWR